ncbi:MAG: DNA recombination protein RmuC [Acidobacteria bacterium]|nr:DNA recombination protein RmuC [Acidobacteriota bacterium]
MEWVFAAFLLLLAVLLVAALRRPGPEDAGLRSLETLARSLGHVQSELARIGRSQDDLRSEVQRGREASLLEIAQAAQGLRSEIGQTHKALAEVKALELGRARQMEQAAESLRRLEAVVAGSSARGAAGENILARAFGQLPPDMLELNLAFGGRVVEYALRLPAGRYLPIDSKWTSAGALERLDAAEDPQERRRLLEHVARELRGRAREMAKYLDPERTPGLGLLAVPDAVYGATPEVHAEAFREGVLVVPYSLALPYVLALYRLMLRFGASVDTDRLVSRLRALDDALRRLDDEAEGRLSRGLVQIENARDAVRALVGEARRSAGALLAAAGAEEMAAAEEPPGLTLR